MSRYFEIKDEFSTFTHPELFYAFSNEQFAEGSKPIPKDKKIYKDDMGGYGTKEGFEAREKVLDDIEEKIKKECTPQEIYDYEFDNHECRYVGNDSEALEIALFYFPDSKEFIKRKR